MKPSIKLVQSRSGAGLRLRSRPRHRLLWHGRECWRGLSRLRRGLQACPCIWECNRPRPTEPRARGRREARYGASVQRCRPVFPAIFFLPRMSRRSWRSMVAAVAAAARHFGSLAACRKPRCAAAATSSEEGNWRIKSGVQDRPMNWRCDGHEMTIAPPVGYSSAASAALKRRSTRTTII